MLQKSIIVDTGFFLALLDKSDSYHTKALVTTKTFSDLEWITTWPVISELSHMLQKVHMHKLLELHHKNLFSIFPLEGCIRRLAELYDEYEDKNLDLADLSLVLLAEQLNHGKILTCDRKDFSFLKWKDHKSFTNLFL